MSVEPTSAAKPTVLPPWLAIDLATTPQSPEALAEDSQRALRAALSGGATADVTISGGGARPGRWDVDEVSVTVRGWTLVDLPAGPASAAATGTGSDLRIAIGRARVSLDRPCVRGFRFRSVDLDLRRLEGSLTPTEGGCRVALLSAESAMLRCTVAPPDVEAFLRGQAPWLREVSVQFAPGARLLARARVSLGLVAIPGQAEGRLTVDGGERIVLTEIRATLANGRPAPAMVAERLRGANPILDIGDLRSAGWPVRLDEPAVEDGLLVLTGHGG
jgi:hypothetical protein